MTYRMTWDVPQILNQLRACAGQVASPYNDGWNSWHCKQDLLQIKYELEQILENLPKFSGEEEFCREQEKRVVWRRLSHTKSQ